MAIFNADAVKKAHGAEVSQGLIAVYRGWI